MLLPLSYADSTESPNALLDRIDALVLGGLLLSMQSSGAAFRPKRLFESKALGLLYLAPAAGAIVGDDLLEHRG